MMLLAQTTQAAIQRLWRECAADGIPPHSAIEQLSYLILLKLLDERPEASCGPQQPVPDTVRWRYLRTLPIEACLDCLCDTVCAWLQKSELAKGMPSLAHAHITFSRASVLGSVMDLIDALFAPARPASMHAEVYEALLRLAEEATAAWAQRAGQYFTPMHLARFLVDLVQPRPGESICDLTCGNGRLLLAALEYLQREHGEVSGGVTFCPDGRVLPGLSDTAEVQPFDIRLFGYDRDHTVAWQAWMHLFCAGVPSPHIRVADTLSKAFNQQIIRHTGPIGTYDILLGNPPYHAAVDTEELGESLRGLGTTKAELLFLELFLQVLAPGGRAAVIVPDGILFNSSRPFIAMRRKLVQEYTIQAIISLPQGVFLPYAGVKTSILVLTGGGHTENILFYTVGADGTSLEAKRQSRPEQTDLPDALVKYSLRVGARPISAFVTADTWLCWENVEASEYSRHFTRPLAIERYEFDDTATPQKVVVCFGSMAVPLEKPKDWLVPVSELGSDYNLMASRYAPFSLDFRRREKRAMTRNALVQDERDAFSLRKTAPGQGQRARVQRSCQERVAEVFSLPEQEDDQSLEAWFDREVEHFFLLHDEGELERGEVRRLIELLLEVKCGIRARRSSHTGILLAQPPPGRLPESLPAPKQKMTVIGQGESLSVRKEKEQVVMVPLALEWV
jgi:type I restriction enzyme M protein